MGREELVEYVRCVWFGPAWVERTRVDKRIEFGFTNSVGTGEVLEVFLCCGGVGEEWLGPVTEGVECSPINEKLSFTYDYFHINRTLP